MNTNKKREIEVKGTNVDEAVATGLAQLGVDRADVIIDVLDEGSRGLLGLGARKAVVRLVSMGTQPTPQPTPEPEPEPQMERVEVEAEVAEVQEVEVETAVSAPSPTPRTSKQPPPEPGDDPDEEERDTAVAIVQTLVQEMQIQTTITTIISEPDDMTGEKINIIQIEGEDLGVLIGPRGETLNALQYVTRLIVSHQLQRRTSFVIDIAGYRQRRELALTRLAERMAGKAIKRGRPVSLEPMPPHERRIIHMTLRDNDAVHTNSVGEGKHRKVRILPN